MNAYSCTMVSNVCNSPHTRVATNYTPVKSATYNRAAPTYRPINVVAGVHFSFTLGTSLPLVR